MPGITNWIDARTQFFDLAVLAGIGRGIKQVVIVDAEQDTRAYRLRLLPDVVFFEIDTPQAIKRKKDVVSKMLSDDVSPRPIYVPLEAQGTLPEALYATPFSPHQPSIFIFERTLSMQPKNRLHALLQGASDLMAEGSEVVFDFVHEVDTDLHVDEEAGGMAQQEMRRTSTLLQSFMRMQAEKVI